MSKPKFRVVTNLGERTAQIFLYGIIGDYWDNPNPINARVVQQLLYSVSDYTRVDLHLNGPGGDTLEAFPIANIIKSFSSKQDIHTYNDGICASSFAIILLAVKKENRHGARGSMAMIHSASTCACGNKSDFKDSGEMLTKYDETLGTFIADALEITTEEAVTTYMDDKDHWFSSAEAEAAGLYTVEDYAAVPMPENVQEMKVDKVAAFFKPQSNITNTDMSILKFGTNLKKVEALGKTPVAERTTAQLDEANAELIAEGITGVTLVPDADLQETVTAAAKVPALETQVTALSTDKNTLTEKVNALEKTVADQKALLKLPGEEIENPVTDKLDTTGEKKVTNAFETSFDREIAGKFGNK